MRDGSDRLPALDALRVVAMLGVFLKHSSFATGLQLRDGWAWTNHFEIGPSIFFALSAFLVYRPFVRAHVAGAPVPSLRDFGRRRVVRIVPAYWCALAVFLLVDRASQHDGIGMHFGGVRGVLGLLTFTHIYSPAHFFDGIAAAYTLDVEVSFYVFVVGWVLLVRRLARGRDPLRTEWWGIAALFLVNVVWRVLVVVVARPETLRCTANSTHWTCAAANWLPGFLDCFALGMACAVLVSTATDSVVVRAVRARYAGIVALVLACAGLVGYSVVFGTTGLDSLVRRRDVLLAHEARFVLVAVLLVPAVVRRPGRSVLARLAASPVVRWTAMVSYGFYLWHQGWLDIAVRAVGGRQFDASFAAVASMALVGALATAAASWYLLEQPVARWTSRRFGAGAPAR